MTLSWLASTNQGPMVGDYIATSILAGEALETLRGGERPAAASSTRPCSCPPAGCP
jgi:hypothetical protein